MCKKIKQILNLKKLALRISHLIPRQHHLHGTILHRVIGERLFDPHYANELAGYTGMLRIFFRYAMPLWVGSLISATGGSIVVYTGISSVWWLVSKLRGKIFNLDNETTPSGD